MPINADKNRTNSRIILCFIVKSAQLRNFADFGAHRSVQIQGPHYSRSLQKVLKVLKKKLLNLFLTHSPHPKKIPSLLLAKPLLCTYHCVQNSHKNVIGGFVIPLEKSFRSFVLISSTYGPPGGALTCQMQTELTTGQRPSLLLCMILCVQSWPRSSGKKGQE